MTNDIFHILKKEVIEYNIPELDVLVAYDSKDSDIIEIHLDRTEPTEHRYFEITYDEMIGLNAIFNKILQKKEV